VRMEWLIELLLLFVQLGSTVMCASFKVKPLNGPKTADWLKSQAFVTIYP